jgi:hypothetical protein
MNYALWFVFNPLEHVLTNALSDKADAIMGLDEHQDALTVATLSAIWLIAMTSGFIVVGKASEANAVQVQLDRLTVLLYLAAVVLVLYMLVLGASTFAAASLLAQSKEGTSKLVQQLALTEALNFGVFWSLFLAAMHYPSVWAAIRNSSVDRLDQEVPSPTLYYRKLATTLSVFSPLIMAIITKLLGSLIPGQAHEGAG